MLAWQRLALDKVELLAKSIANKIIRPFYVFLLVSIIYQANWIGSRFAPDHIKVGTIREGTQFWFLNLR
jgi:hypothetical protein